jgi:hypothetical protein
LGKIPHVEIDEESWWKGSVPEPRHVQKLLTPHHVKEVYERDVTSEEIQNIESSPLSSPDARYLRE